MEILVRPSMYQFHDVSGVAVAAISEDSYGIIFAAIISG